MIYFIRSQKTGHIKIGYTKQFNVRFTTLKKQHGDLDLLGVMPGDPSRESDLHLQFKHLNVYTGYISEWHYPGDDLLAFVRENAKAVYERGIDDNPRQTFGLTLTEEIKEAITQESEKTHIPESELVRMALKEFFSNRGYVFKEKIARGGARSGTGPKTGRKAKDE